jgi:hypothetical protein
MWDQKRLLSERSEFSRFPTFAPPTSEPPQGASDRGAWERGRLWRES